ncbi:hypothetical protein LOK49_LG01G02566, partial [Camellia lanceoleosa]
MQKYEGYPSGSMVDFACDAYGSPILAISSLAVHTKDLVANPKCSLLVAKDLKDRTDLIITLHGDVSVCLFSMHSFPFLAYISISHMNKDHAEDTKLIVQHSTSIPRVCIATPVFSHLIIVSGLGFRRFSIAGYRDDSLETSKEMKSK